MRIISNRAWDNYLMLKNNFDKIKQEMHVTFTHQNNINSTKILEEQLMYDHEIDRLKRKITSQTERIADLMIKLDKLQKIKVKTNE